MKNSFASIAKYSLVALCMTLFFAACEDSSFTSPENSNPSNGPSETENTNEDGNEDSVCGFSKADNVWKFSYSTWNYIDVYTWVDETTVDFKEYMNSYHMDKNDTTYTNVNRDEFYEKVLKECQSYNDIEAE